MKWGLSDKSINAIRAILQKYSTVEKAVLYGSRAKGNFRKGSDIDLALFGVGLDSKILGKICLDFDDSYLPYKFDVSIFDTLSDPDFIDHIKRVGVTFYEKK
jgi:predicted nucleotidyltransferase